MQIRLKNCEKKPRAGEMEVGQLAIVESSTHYGEGVFVETGDVLYLTMSGLINLSRPTSNRIVGSDMYNTIVRILPVGAVLEVEVTV